MLILQSLAGDVQDGTGHKTTPGIKVVNPPQRVIGALQLISGFLAQYITIAAML
jgi:hypothetical protein